MSNKIANKKPFTLTVSGLYVPWCLQEKINHLDVYYVFS